MHEKQVHPGSTPFSGFALTSSANASKVSPSRPGPALPEHDAAHFLMEVSESLGSPSIVERCFEQYRRKRTRHFHARHYLRYATNSPMFL